MRRPAFTLFEVTVVVAVLAALAAVMLPMYRHYAIRSDLDNAVQQISQSLGRARTLSISGQGDSTWGVYVPGALLFKGATYQTRDPAFDEVYPVSSTIEVSGLEQVTYSRLLGEPSATGTIVLTAITRDRRQVSILLGREGIPVTAEDHLTICHCESVPQKTMTVPDNAWPGHRNHGDFLGVCRMTPQECPKK